MIPLLVAQCASLAKQCNPLDAEEAPQDLLCYFQACITDQHLWVSTEQGVVKAFAVCFWIDDVVEADLIEQGIWPPATQQSGRIFYVHSIVSRDRASMWRLWKARPKGHYMMYAKRLSGRRPNHVMAYLQ